MPANTHTHNPYHRRKVRRYSECQRLIDIGVDGYVERSPAVKLMPCVPAGISEYVNPGRSVDRGGRTAVRPDRPPTAYVDSCVRSVDALVADACWQ